MPVPEPTPPRNGTVRRVLFDLVTASEDEASVAIDLASGEVRWSAGAYRIHERDGGSFDPSTADLTETVLSPDVHAVRTFLRRAVRARGPLETVYRARLPHGQGRWVHAHCTPQRGLDGVVCRLDITLRDIDVDGRDLDAARFGCGVDQLTGLPGRDAVVTALARARDAGGEPVALLVADVMGFRRLNEELGVEACDRRLASFAGRLRQLAGDDLLARIGADSFAWVTPLSSGDPAAAIEQIAEAWQWTRGDGLGTSHCLVSHTVAADPGEDPVDWLQRAESELSDARMADTTRRQRPENPRAIDGVLLQEALEAGHLHVAYQPKVELLTGRVLSFEALARWTDPQSGPVSPGEFIPVAEASGLIDRLGAWVLETACTAVAGWNEAALTNPPLHVSVNVSPLQFAGDLAGTVERSLAASGLRPEHLTLEVTESTIMDDVGTSIATLERLRALGVRVSVDDFGTGHSSLATLRDLPIDELKIDRAFVTDLGDAPEASALCSAIVALAHTLDLDVVAEGIETAAQAEELRRLGCDVGQGYLYARPVPADAAPDIVSRLRGVQSCADVSCPTALIVDDAPEVRQLVRLSLRPEGFVVTEAATAADGLEAAVRDRPDIIILDVSLPDGRGHELCQQIRSLPAGAEATIVMLTAHNETEVKVAAYNAGADDYIVKPFSPRDLVSRVQSARARTARA